VRGIGTGEVNAEQFRRWVKQDYLFLVEYCRMLALGAARSPDLGTLRRFADLLSETEYSLAIRTLQRLFKHHVKLQNVRLSRAV